MKGVTSHYFETNDNIIEVNIASLEIIDRDSPKHLLLSSRTKEVI